MHARPDVNLQSFIIKCQIYNQLKMLAVSLVLALLVPLVTPNFLLDLTSTSSWASSPSTLHLSFRTTSSFAFLDIVLSNDFTIATPTCTVNGATATCSRIVPNLGSTIGVRVSFGFVGSPAANGNYTVGFNVTNPLYADTFSVDAFAGSVPFSNDAVLTINPKEIQCSLEMTSPIVGQSTNANFSLGLSTLPPGSLGKISISATVQSVYPNIINNSPLCTFDGSNGVCSLSNVFGQQVLTLSSASVGIRPGNSRAALIVSTLRNAPYSNATFDSIRVTVQDSQDRAVEACAVDLPIPSVLQQSTGLSVQGWQPRVGQVSNVRVLVTPSLPVINNTRIILEHSTVIRLTPLSPATYTLTPLGPLLRLTISNYTLASPSLSFNLTFENPSSVQPITFTVYLSIGDNLYRERRPLSTNTLVLQKQQLQVTVQLGNSVTLVDTMLNASMVSNVRVNGGVVLRVAVGLGRLGCGSLGMQSNLAVVVAGCAVGQVNLTTSDVIQANSTLWISFRYFTYTSVAANTLAIIMTDPLSAPIMDGSSPVTITPSQISLSITALNSTFTAVTNYTIKESNLTAIPLQVVRNCTFELPAWMKVTDGTQVLAQDNTTRVPGYVVDPNSNTVSATVAGVIQVTITDVRNPGHYLAGRTWTTTCWDPTQVQSGTGTSTQTPGYSPALSPLTLVLSPRTIQHPADLTLTLQPLLQYSLATPPLYTIQLSSGALINASQCPNCILLTSSRLSVPYTGVIQQVVVSVMNGDEPGRHRVDFSLVLDGTVYERGLAYYQLQPMQYEYSVALTGLYGSMGVLEIRVMSVLARSVNLTYEGTASVFSAAEQCQQCNSTYLRIVGVVGYFQMAVVKIRGIANGTVYASADVQVGYPCNSVPGCQICHTANTSLFCTRCFPQTLSPQYLLFQGACYADCPVSTYQTGAICSQCPGLCFRCNASTCLQCTAGYYIYNSICVSECPALHIRNSTHCLPRPVICPAHCIACPSDNTCLKCDAGYYLLQDVCYGACPSGYLADEQLHTCAVFVPPQETSSFPFAFLIATVVVLILLGVVRLFERRSLVVGNFIAVGSVLELGAAVMMLGYTFGSMGAEPGRWDYNNRLLFQALLYIIVVTKVALNVIFLIYFIVKISSDEVFHQWRNRESSHNKLYLILLTMSSVLSFQVMRVMYCRLLGLELFFGRFNSTLIFRPLNLLSLAHVIPAGCLLVMAAINITMQGGYRTAILYSSIQVIIVEAVIMGACVVEYRRTDREYFEYQVYRVDNADEQFSAAKISLEEQLENGGSCCHALVGADSTRVEDQRTGRIVSNRPWREIETTKERGVANGRKQEDSDVVIDEAEQEQGSSELQSSQMLKLQSSEKPVRQSVNQQQRRSIFRMRILEDWEKIKHLLPQTRVPGANLRSSMKLSFVDEEKKSSRKINKVSSLDKLQKVQVRSPIPNFRQKQKLKSYFYNISESKKQPQEVQDMTEEKSEVDQKGSDKIYINEALFEDNTVSGHNIDEIREQQSHYQNQGIDQIDKHEPNLSEIRMFKQDQSFEKNFFEFDHDSKTNRYDKTKEEAIDEDIEGQKSTQNQISARNFRKVKKRKVNKQTEAVYLQRLVSSSQNHRSRSLHRARLRDF